MILTSCKTGWRTRYLLPLVFCRGLQKTSIVGALATLLHRDSP